MFCSKCGNQCKEGAKFCNKCGAPLATSDLNATDNKKGKVYIYIICIVVVVLLIGLFIYLFCFDEFNGFLKKTEDTETSAVIEDNDVEKKDKIEMPEEKNLNKEVEISKTDSDSITSETEIVDWKSIYLDYFNQLRNEGKLDYYVAAGLIYVDEDDIPELYLEGDCEASGCLILTCGSGKADALQTSRLCFTYIEKHNLLNNSDGHMGCYYDHIYRIDDGKWVCIAKGEYEAEYGEDGYVLDENDDMIMHYKWMDKEVSLQEYENELSAVYNVDMAKEPDSHYVLDEMESILLTGKTTSQNHRYELIVTDITWQEAEMLCRQKGGYLATLTTQEEFDRITEQIVREGKTKISFFVGATRDEAFSDNGGYHWIYTPHNDTGFSSVISSFWLSGEPSYSGVTDKGETVEEKYVDLFYRQSEGRCYLNDVADDILMEAPGYKGLIGYICEYDN